MATSRILYFGPDLVVAEVDGNLTFTDESGLPGLVKGSRDCVIGVVPVTNAVVTASASTLDAALGSKVPAGHTARTEELSANLFQAFIIDDELFGRLRALGRRVKVVPYSAAVRKAFRSIAPAPSAVRRLTRVFTEQQAAVVSGQAAVIFDAVKGEHLMVALRGEEIVAVRRLRGGDPLVELQRTVAASRLENPRVVCVDPDLVPELQARGYTAEAFPDATVVAGWPFLGAIDELRFLSTAEIARARARRYRARAIGTLVASLVAVLTAGGAFLYTAAALAVAEGEQKEIQARKGAVSAKLFRLYVDKYPAQARKTSVRINDDLFELLLALPPQVQLISVEKQANAPTKVVVERRPDAAPFGRGDLLAVLRSSARFGAVQIREEYQGHIVRYHLTLGKGGG